MDNIFIEAGINHFGSIREAKIILNYFLKSKFKNLTFMLHSGEFYSSNNFKLGINFYLPKNFYSYAIKECHKKNKKLGLAVCDAKTFSEISDIKFDFYKLLSIAINEKDLIKHLKKKKKPVFISTGHKVRDKEILNCINEFKSKKNLSLLHAPMTYNINELNLSRINFLKKKFQIKTGYSNHNNDKESLIVVSSIKPDYLFLYCKPLRKKLRKYPDDKHAFFLDEIEEIIQKYNKYNNINKNVKNLKKINIFNDGIKF